LNIAVPLRVPTLKHRLHRKLIDFSDSSIDELADAESINTSYVSRVLRTAYLSPVIVEAILDGKYPAHLTMKNLMEPFPMDWDRQAEHFFAEKPSHTAGAQG